ncbi:MAG: DNA methyltransferase [archaeon]|nr:DNA methyltransferase [archaeon]
MKYLFILGRNVKLSIAEVFSFLEKENIQILNHYKRNNSILIETDKALGDIVNKFGGVIAIGEVLTSGKIEKIINDIEKINLYNKKENKFNYALWNFSDEDSISEISIYLKKRFKSEKLKASEKTFRGLIKLQNMDFAENIPSKNSIKEEYFLFSDSDNKNDNFFGIVNQRCDYDQIEERDMKKPVRRQELAISPRLAKIIINLSQANENEILLDPFCGIGVILEEALLQNKKVIGIDKDKEAIGGAKKNLEWFKFKKTDYQLIVGDSRNIIPERANVIVTEPSLGKTLRKAAKKEEAEKIMNDFENLMISVLNNLKSKISGKIVFTSPLIKTTQGRIPCNFENILKNTGLKLGKIKDINFPIPEFREDQIVGRNIVVLDKY